MYKMDSRHVLEAVFVFLVLWFPSPFISSNTPLNKSNPQDVQQSLQLLFVLDILKTYQEKKQVCYFNKMFLSLEESKKQCHLILIGT